MQNRPKVLMFGWEFPPVISGGLGVACLGLCKALSPLADVKMIIPKSVPDFKIPNIELIGLNAFSREELRDMFSKKSKHGNHGLNFYQINAGVNPYIKIDSNESINKKFYDVYNQNIEPFEIDALYAGDVIKKAIEFSRISVQYALLQDFDVIHAHDWLTFLPAIELKMLTGKPLVLHVHSLEYDRSGADIKNWVYDLEKKAMDLADRIIPVSNYTGDICHTHYGVPKYKIIPIHNGVESIKHTVKKSPHKDKLIIFFGRITMQKGPEFFVEAAKLVLKYHNNVKFVMAGSGDLHKPLIEKIASYGLGDKFFFTGFLNKQKLNELLAISEVYCMPSVSEPFGLSAVEAVQYGLPVIMSKTSGAGEVLSSALKIDFWDTHKLAQYMIASIDYKGLSAEMVGKADKDLKHITWEKTADKVMQIYEILIL
ncbi:MAG: glycosyltransferase [Bacteroidia bacterium]|nr:glycosyltransferase [Bacteroidia bacterium]